jgi:hypothetical protein
MVVHKSFNTVPLPCGEDIVRELKKNGKHVESFFYAVKQGEKKMSAKNETQSGASVNTNEDTKESANGLDENSTRNGIKSDGENYLGKSKSDFANQELRAKAKMLHFLITQLR